MAAPRWQGFVEEFVLGEQSSSINEIAEELQSGNVKLLDIVEGLGPHLTSKEKHIRCRATQLLSEILHELPSDFLSEKEVDVLTEFYCNRIKDHFTVAPHVLFGMVALSWQPLLRDEAVVKIVRVIFSEVHTQSLQQTTRRNVYTILENFLCQRLSALLPMGGDFVIGYIQTMDSEKDPRCLVVAFRSVKIIAQNFPIGVFAEELFEVVACYFPIDFTPPPNDPNQVTREDLITGLRGSLSGSPKFAEFCFPLLIEKITSSIPSAKLDALQTLAACTDTYGAEALQEFLITLWSEIRREVFSPQSEALEGAALAALTAMVATLSNHTTEAGTISPLFSFIDEIFKACQRHLTEPELRLIYPSAKLLQAVAAASDPACTKVTHQVVPVLVDQFHKHPQVNQRRNIVDLLITFFKITMHVIQSKEAVNPLLQHKDALFPVVMSLLADHGPTLRCLAVRATSVLLQVPGFVTDAERHLVAENLTNIILKDPDMSVKEEAVKAAVSMAKEDMDIVKDKILSKLLQWIREEKMETNPAGVASPDVQEQDKAEFIYKAIGQVSCQPDLIKTAAPQLLTRIANMDAQPFTPELVRESQYTCTCLRTVTSRGVTHPASLEFLKSHLLPSIFVLTISGALSDRGDAIVTQWSLVETLASCVRNIVQNLKQSSELVATIVRTFMVGDLSSFNDVINNNSIGFQPLKITSHWRQTQLLSLLSAVVSSVPRESPVPQLDLLMSRLREVACGTSHPHSATVAAKCFSALLNKLPDDEAVSSLTQSVCQGLEEVVECVSVDVGVRQQALTLWAWVTKAVVLRGHPAQTGCVNKLIECLKNASLGPTAAQGFHIVLHEYDDVMTTSMHANVRLMFRQRFFMQTSGRLVEGFNTASPAQRVHYLRALSHLLNNLPKQVLSTELPPLLPLLIQSLTCDDVGLQLSTMTTMADLLRDNPKLLASHVDEIIPSLLRMTTYKPNMNVRVEALTCLGLMTSLPTEILVPHQTKVTRELGGVVGDHKRRVRTQAVDTRCQWYLLSSPTK